MARREQVFHQFLRPLKGIGLPVNYNVAALPSYESEIAFDRGKSKFLFSIEQNEGQEDFKWVTISRAHSVEQVNSNYTVDDDDYIILADASAGEIHISLPPAATVEENTYNIKRISGGENKVYIDATNNELIDGQSGVEINSQYATLTVISNGSQWFII
jgi:hypothetical protein